MEYRLITYKIFKGLILLGLTLISYQLIGQEITAPNGAKKSKMVQVSLENGDTIYDDWILPGAYVYAKANGRAASLAKKRNLLRYNIYKVFPYVKHTVQMLNQLDSAYAKLGDGPKFRNYRRSQEKALMNKYKPLVKDMTYSQGKVIVLLINRESGRPPYQVIKDLKGGFQATIWQGVAKLFDNNLKRTYDPTGRDQDVERIVQEYEMGFPY